MYIINVTQEDIDKGKPGSFCSCPVALAATRAIGVPVTAGRQRLVYSLKGYIKDLELPPEATAFINKFDWATWAKVEPFSFTVGE